MSQLNQFTAEINSGFVTLYLLKRIDDLAAKNREAGGLHEVPYTQGLMNFLKTELGVSPSTCFTRLRLLKFGGYVTEHAGNKGGKGIVGYGITEKGIALMSELRARAEFLLSEVDPKEGR